MQQGHRLLIAAETAPFCYILLRLTVKTDQATDQLDQLQDLSCNYLKWKVVHRVVEASVNADQKSCR